MKNGATKPKEERPVRSDEELERMKSARERGLKRHVPVEVDLRVDDDGKLSLRAPHDDSRGWLFRLADAFGTNSDTVALGRLNELVAMTPADDKAPNHKVNTMLAHIDSIRPGNEAEGALASQMAATHQLAMAALARSANASTIPQMEANGTLATKLLRTYTMQMDAFAKLRRGGEQKVKVEHVHVYDGGQAIVGHVQPQGGGGRFENGQQAHAPTDPRALAFAPMSPLLRDDAGGDRMPVSSGKGESPMPNARRGLRKRGTAR